MLCKQFCLLTARNAALQMALMILTLYKGLNILYYGKSVAKLPFEPFKLMRAVTQRGLTSPATNDCAMVRFEGCLYLMPVGCRSHAVWC